MYCETVFSELQNLRDRMISDLTKRKILVNRMGNIYLQ